MVNGKYYHVAGGYMAKFFHYVKPEGEKRIYARVFNL